MISSERWAPHVHVAPWSASNTREVRTHSRGKLAGEVLDPQLLLSRGPRVLLDEPVRTRSIDRADQLPGGGGGGGGGGDQ